MQERNEYSQALLDAMSIISKSGDNSLQYDKTIECEIVRAVDSSTGEYKVRYLNGMISVYDLTLKMAYRSGDIIYVSVPLGDFSSKKIIIGKKSQAASDLKDVVLDSERVNLVGLPIETIYPSLGDFADEIGIYGSTLEEGFSILAMPEETDNDATFRGYAQGKNALMISAAFKTDWYYPTIVSGNYGVRITFETLDGQYLRYILDCNKMTGDYFNYSNAYYTNYALLSIDGDNLKRVVAVEFFSEDFKRSNDVSEENLRARYDVKDYEIFMSNLTIQFAEQVDLDGYTVSISPLRGIYFNNASDLLLQANLKYNGNPDCVDGSKISYYWFEQDSSITVYSENYDSIGGIGWRSLGINTKVATISADSFVAVGAKEKVYKVVAFYEDYRAANTITLFLSEDTSNPYSLEVSYSADGRKASLTVFPDPGDEYYAAWVKEDENGNRFNLGVNGFTLSDIDIGNMNGIHVFYCTLFKIDSKYAAMTLTKELSKMVPFQEFETKFIIDDGGVFYYDEAGVVTNERVTKSIDFSIYPDNLTYDYEWLFLDYQNDGSFMYEPVSSGKELTGNQSTADKSIDFLINRKFSREAAEDNIIQLVISMGGNKYYFNKTLEFVKEGDPGTNGSSLIMRVNYQDSKAILADGATTSIIPLAIQMYFNGSPTYDGQNINNYFTFSASVPRDYKLNNPLKDLNLTFEQQSENTWNLTVPAYNLDLTKFNSIVYIKARSKGNVAFPYDIGYVLPLAQTTESIYQTYEFIGPTLIQYDEMGYNPKWDNSLPRLIDKEGSTVVSSFAALGDLVLDDGEIKPLEYFDPNNLSYGLNANDIYIQPVAGSLNAFSKSILNAWDGASIQINESEGYVLASQIGAGVKEDDNSFTGVLMGSLSSGETGLLGFYQGATTFGFLSDGTGFLGGSGEGRIEFNPSSGTAVIQSGNYVSGSSGMKINLTDGAIDSYNFKLTSSFLTLDSVNKKFTLTDLNGKTLINVSSGSYYLQSSNYATSSGTVTAGMKINLATGEISSKNFTISSTGNATFSGNITGATITGSSFGTTSDDFYVSSTGKLTAKSAKLTSATISGTISATYLECDNGDLGGWTINSYGIYKSNNAIWSSGEVSLGGGAFGVNSDGETFCDHLLIGGGSYTEVYPNGGSVTINSAPVEMYQTSSTGGFHVDCRNNIIINSSNGVIGFRDKNTSYIKLEDLANPVAVFG